MKKAGSGAAARIESLRADAKGCRDCPLWKNATQTVFGEGDARAGIDRGEGAPRRELFGTAARYVKD